MSLKKGNLGRFRSFKRVSPADWHWCLGPWLAGHNKDRGVEEELGQLKKPPMVWYWEVRADFNTGNGMKGGTQSYSEDIYRIPTTAHTVPDVEDRSVDTPGRKQGKKEVGVGQGGRKETDYTPAFSSKLAVFSGGQT